jgi:hypothetical protein
MVHGGVAVMSSPMLAGSGHLAMHRPARDHRRRGVPLEGQCQRNDPDRDNTRQTVHEPDFIP